MIKGCGKARATAPWSRGEPARARNSNCRRHDRWRDYARLTPFFEQLLSIDPQQRDKPPRDTYATACRQVQVAPADTLLLAAHGWDIAGARHAGLQASFIARPGQQHPLAPQPTLTGATVAAVAKQLIG